MTQRSVTYLKGRFETGDTPTGSDYADIFDSFLSLEASAEQSLNGKLNVSVISAGTVSANDLHVNRSSTMGYQDLRTAGTTQASAAVARYDVTRILVTAAAQQERSVSLYDHHPGRVQYVINDANSATVANVFPQSGCNFLGTAENGPLLLAAGQTIQIIHVDTSAYSYVRY